MGRGLSAIVAMLVMAGTRSVLAAEEPDKPTFEQYLRESAVSKEVIDRFLEGPSWAQYDPELGYVLGNYLPADGMDKSTTISTVQANGARTSFVYADKPCRINLKLYFIGHYNPRGNHFFAYSLKDTVVNWLDPKPITYRNPDPQSVDFQGYLPAAR